MSFHYFNLKVIHFFNNLIIEKFWFLYILKFRSNLNLIFNLKKNQLNIALILLYPFSLPESTCEQAVANTQVIDNFQIKITGDQRESAGYLVIMTRFLQSKYQVQCSWSYKDFIIYLQAYLSLIIYSVKNLYDLTIAK